MIGVKVGIEEIRRTGGRDKDGREMVVVKLRNQDQKKEGY